jgi:hypothetical protein
MKTWQGIAIGAGVLGLAVGGYYLFRPKPSGAQTSAQYAKSIINFYNNQLLSEATDAATGSAASAAFLKLVSGVTDSTTIYNDYLQVYNQYIVAGTPVPGGGSSSGTYYSDLLNRGGIFTQVAAEYQSRISGITDLGKIYGVYTDLMNDFASLPMNEPALYPFIAGQLWTINQQITAELAVWEQKDSTWYFYAYPTPPYTPIPSASLLSQIKIGDLVEIPVNAACTLSYIPTLGLTYALKAGWNYVTWK